MPDPTPHIARGLLFWAYAKLWPNERKRKKRWGKETHTRERETERTTLGEAKGRSAPCQFFSHPQGGRPARLSSPCVCVGGHSHNRPPPKRRSLRAPFPRFPRTSSPSAASPSPSPPLRFPARPLAGESRMLAPCPAAPPSWLLLGPGFHKRAAPSLSFVPQASLALLFPPLTLPLSPSPQAAPPAGGEGFGGAAAPVLATSAGRGREAKHRARQAEGSGGGVVWWGVFLCHARSADGGDRNARTQARAAQAEARPGSPLKGGEDGQAWGLLPSRGKGSFVSPLLLPRHPCSVGGRGDICAPVGSSGGSVCGWPG